MKVIVTTSIIVGVFLVACNPNKVEKNDATIESPTVGEPKKAASPSTTSLPDAETLFSQRCVVCHGETGEGNGPGAAAMTPKPRSFSDKEWQANITDEDLKKVIVGGGMAVGKSPLMPGNPDLKDKPEIVEAVVKKVRSYNK